MKYHKLSKYFPLLKTAELNELANDIKEKGQIEPVWIYENQILDGRNRYLACAKAGVPCKSRQYTGKDPLGFVVSMNLRRHMTTSERAAAAVELEPAIAEEAKKRQLSGKKTDLRVKIPLGGKSTDEAAKIMKVSGSSVTKAKAIKKENPVEFKKIREGKKTIGQVKREMRETVAKTKTTKANRYSMTYEKIFYIQIESLYSVIENIKKSFTNEFRMIPNVLHDKMDVIEKEIRSLKYWHPKTGRKCSKCSGSGMEGKVKCRFCYMGKGGM